MLTNAVAAPFTLIATGNAVEVESGTARSSATRTALSTCTSRPASTLPGNALAGGWTVTDTCAFAPGSSVATRSDNESQLAGPPVDALVEYFTLPPDAAFASTAEKRTVSRNPALSLVTTNERTTELPGSTATSRPVAESSPTSATRSSLAGTSLRGALVGVAFGALVDVAFDATGFGDAL